MRVLRWLLAIVVLGALAVGGYFAKTKYDAYMGALNGCRSERDELKGKWSERDSELARLGKERDDEKAARNDTDKLINAAQTDLTATRAELEELRQERNEAEQ